MPYKSEAQKRKLQELAAQGKIKHETIAEMERESAGMKLPERLKPKKQETIRTIQQLREIGKKKR